MWLNVKFRFLIDGQPPRTAHGIDVDDQRNDTVAEQRLYQLIRQPKPIADRQFAIEFFGSGVEALCSRSVDPKLAARHVIATEGRTHHAPAPKSGWRARSPDGHLGR